MPSGYHEVTPGIEINYTIHEPTIVQATAKPWIILISGLGDTQGTWFNQVPAFTAAGYTVLTFDNRGVGLSSRARTPGEQWTIGTLAGDVRSLVKALPVPAPYHVLGVSMGGMITQRYALDVVAEGNEAELASVIPACTFATPSMILVRLSKLIIRIATSMSVADANRVVAFLCWTPDFFNNPENQGMLDEMDHELDKMDDHVEGMGLSSFLAQLDMAKSFDVREELVRSQLGFKTKVIVIAGEQDLLIPTSVSYDLHLAIKGSKWRTVKGGHVCKLEFPNEFNKACLDAWAEVESDRPSH
jgi:3-oxoadipate enol-lactonase